MVSDEGAPPLSSTATVVIEVLDENDNSPQFSHKLFQVNSLSGRARLGLRRSTGWWPVMTMWGPTAMIKYSLEDSSEDRFDIHLETGVVTTRGELCSGATTVF